MYNVVVRHRIKIASFLSCLISPVSACSFKVAAHSSLRTEAYVQATSIADDGVAPVGSAGQTAIYSQHELILLTAHPMFSL